MIFLENDKAHTSSTASINAQPNMQQTSSGISIDNKPITKNESTSNIELHTKDDEKKPEQLITQRPAITNNLIMDAFISTVSSKLNKLKGDYILAAESGDIVATCKSYLQSLYGDQLARRYVATTMLVVRNSYSELNEDKRSKVVDYLSSYYEAEQNPEIIRSEQLKLYRAGLKPL